MDTRITPRNCCRTLYLLQTLVCGLVAVSLLSAGCASTPYIKKRDQTTNPLVSWGVLRPELPPLSERSEKLFRRYDLDKASMEERLVGLQAEITREPTPEKLIAFSELSYLAGLEAVQSKNDSRALDHFCSSITHAYWYLFESGYDSFRNPYDPQFRGACDLYNGALEGALKIAHQEGKLVPGTTYLVETGTRQFQFEIVNHGSWHADEFSKFEFVNDYETPGLANRHHTYGLGVPLVAVRRQHEEMDPAERYYPPGLSFAVTAFLRVNSTLDVCQRPGQTRHCVLELYDPLQVRNIEVAGRQIPLETDLTTSLAYFLDSDEFTENKYKLQLATLSLLLPDLTSPVQGMYMVEPYDPGKIPVIMVHGLWSSPVTWMEMFNDLRSFPEIRQQYQFWFYLYPTGQPFWISARQLREDLDEMRRTIDPEFKNPMLNQMVLVGHSMGGLVSKMQTVDSGDDYWRLLSDRPFSELKADDETREKLAATVYFHPNPAIRRVITIGTPHRGSDFANDYTRWISRKFISLPEMLVRATQGLTLLNPGFFKNTDLLTVSTSIDSLAPDSPVLPLLLESPRAPWTKYHNIVGIVEDDGSIVSSLAAGSDGIVSYRSAHLDEAESESTVPADHVNVHRHPRAILEVRRILLQHRDQAVAELQGLTGATPASFGQPFAEESVRQ